MYTLTAEAAFASLKEENEALRKELKVANKRRPMDYEAVQLALFRVMAAQQGCPVESVAVAFVKEIEQHHGIK